jgi:hypothetical protein
VYKRQWQRLFDLDAIETMLQGAARAGRALSYSEALGQLGYNFSRPKMRMLCAALHAVDERAARRGEPELAILVVRASDGLPGAGWWAAVRPDDYDGLWEGAEAAQYIRARQEKVFKFWREA